MTSHGPPRPRRAPGAGRGPKPTARASAARRAGRSGGVPSVLRRLPATRGTAAS
ncbi:hypothetical protein C884_01143 [Kocuria palustris PEL]|uniref:Uncharacterized protein n=1 Tax=Kocuria palustris PEL TaxID=1236550 RepID=M2YGX6_9MICC|nr:hypothetical protein C884_01143 [Kocuria palustris PEL]